MPNLETISIEINANSQKAMEGVGKLTGSLRGLARAVGTVAPALKTLNRELSQLARYGNVKLPALTGLKAATATARSKEFKATAAVLKEYKNLPVGSFQSWMYGPRPAPTVTNSMGQNTMLSEAESRRLNPQWYQDPRIVPDLNKKGFYTTNPNHTFGTIIPKNNTDVGIDKTKTAAITSNISNANSELNNFIQKTLTADTNTNQLSKTLTGAAQSTKEFGKAAEQAGKRTSGFLGMLGRIAKTMLIRTALRYLMKSFSETWSAAYQYSKGMGGEFANNVEKARGAVASVSTSLVTSFAPVLNALIPVIQTIANAISYLCSLLQRLFSLLGMGSELFGATAESIDKYSKSAGGGGKSTKNLLAAFDELNVVQSSGGGGGGGGIGAKGFLSDPISAEMQTINMIVSESLLGIGLILACTGHIGIGLGMMAIGAAGIAKTFTEDWGKLPANVKRTVAEIATITGEGMIAIGLMALCSGHIPLGIGFMALGAANIGLAMFAADGDPIDNEVKRVIAEIMGIAGASMMAIGLIVAIAGNPILGLGLIAAGAASWYAALSYDPDAITGLVQSVCDKIGGFFVSLWESIKGIWLTVATWFDKNVWTPVADFAKSAWEKVSGWWTTNISEPFSKAWDAVSSYFQTLFGAKDTTGSIAYYADQAWTSISKWWGENIADPITTAWSPIAKFFETLFGDTEIHGSIAHYANDAWLAISEWWSDDILTPIKDTWDSVTEFFKDLFGGTQVPGSIASYANDAWTAISIWWGENILEPIEEVWNKVSSFFSGIWGSAEEGTGIAGFAQKAFNIVAGFWESPILTDVKAAWDGVLEFFDGIFKPIESLLSSIWDFIKSIFGTDSSRKTYNIDVVYTESGTVDLAGMGLVNLPSYIDPYLKFTPSGTNSYSTIRGRADGGYNIPRGDIFIANEAGAELIGSMNGKTTVANQEQIIEGIQRGVRDAQTDQIGLLREQNNLLRGLLDKSWEVNPSAGWGKFNQRSNELWAMQTGR